MRPNVVPWIDPATGHFRFLDLASFTGHTLTMGADPIDPTPLSRDLSGCFGRVVGRGNPIAQMFLFKVSDGTLVENFAHDSYSTNAAAIAAWKPTDYTTTANYQDAGTCTCPSTTTITYTSSNAAASWAANYWDQTSTGRQGVVNLVYSVGTGITAQFEARIVSNTALTAGGNCTLTIDLPMPVTTYDHCTITGIALGGAVVWTDYLIADTTLRADRAPVDLSAGDRNAGRRRRAGFPVADGPRDLRHRPSLHRVPGAVFDGTGQRRDPVRLRRPF